jgi:ferredoxin-type protein NapG
MYRRILLKKLIITASTFGMASIPFAIAKLLAPNEELNFSKHLRPPGALLVNDDFVKACIGCGLCGEICPVKCIKFDKRRGGYAINTPYINPENKACILCMKCTEVCPTEALTIILREEVRMGLAQIDRSACYPWVDRGVCGACVGICPLGKKAIAFEFADIYRPFVKESDCVGCGMCVEICPHPSLPIRIVETGNSGSRQHNI